MLITLLSLQCIASIQSTPLVQSNGGDMVHVVVAAAVPMPMPMLMLLLLRLLFW